jgi:8-oxo-dGTP pyrophosphatase MutT (NUDIX family)
MRYEKSCGAIVFRTRQNVYEFLLIKHRKGGHWGFPKGHVEEAETEHQTAIREVYEETGLKIELLDGFREKETYSPTAGIMKTVVYFLANSVSDDVRYILPEVDDHAWLPLQDALTCLNFDSQRTLLQHAYNFIKHQALS